MRNIKKAMMLGVSGVFVACGALANSGTVDFAGAVVDTTCTVAVNGGGNNSTIKLPHVSTAVLDAASVTAGRVAVRMSLSGCSVVSGLAPTNVNVFWEASPQINAEGRLVNQSATGAQNVEIQMLKDDGVGIINLAKTDGDQNTSVVAYADAAAGTKDLVHFAQYFATGQATAGAVTAQLGYVLSYQ